MRRKVYKFVHCLIIAPIFPLVRSLVTHVHTYVHSHLDVRTALILIPYFYANQSEQRVQFPFVSIPIPFHRKPSKHQNIVVHKK